MLAKWSDAPIYAFTLLPGVYIPAGSYDQFADKFIANSDRFLQVEGVLDTSHIGSAQYCFCDICLYQDCEARSSLSAT